MPTFASFVHPRIHLINLHIHPIAGVSMSDKTSGKKR